MNQFELQDWLLDTALKDDLKALSQLTVAMEIDNLEQAPPSETFDWPNLMLASSILARSETRRHREAALRIATSALLLDASDQVRDSAAVVLEKLANHRSVELAVQRRLLSPQYTERLGLALRLEAEKRRLDNSVLLASTGERLAVNDFQQKFWNGAAMPNSWLSASAPTASGKTFLVLQWMLDALMSSEAITAIYMAPTRALVSEIEGSLGELTKHSGIAIEVSSIPSAQKFRETKSGKKRIFVFTQERLHLLANQLHDELPVDLVVVDEAHKIGDAQRGVILQDAIERIQRSSPHMRAVFVSPSTENPGLLLEDAPPGVERIDVASDSTTVLQNIVVAHQVPRKPKDWQLELREHGEYVPLGVLRLDSKPQGLRKRLAFIAAAAGQRGGTLVYANGAAEAEEIAYLISQLLPQSGVVEPALSELAELARVGVHRQYVLASLVERGVAFHYGNMPSLIRAEIERQFREGRLKFLVCTSTLIEGVNLSCRTIVVRGPRKGKNQPMKPQDFWNLAGRAGRWGDEFQGNIICVDARDTEAWPTGVPDRTKYKIRRETDVAVARADDLVDYLAQRMAGKPVDSGMANRLEQVGAYLITAYLRNGSLAMSPLAQRHGPEEIAKLEGALGEISRGIELPLEVGERNPGVSLIGLQRLIQFFRSYVGPLDDLLPAPSESDDAYDRYKKMMERVNEHVWPAFTPPGLIPLHSLIVVQWLRGLSLPTIIRKRIEFHRSRDIQFDMSSLIRSTLELIEGVARFNAPKFFSAYVDVLNHHLREIGREDLIDHDLDIGVALELGVSSVTLRSLMELGMSRTGAVALYEKIALDNLSERGCIEWVMLQKDNLDNIGLPVIIVREVRDRILSLAVEENGEAG
jgi:hypothetical protein